MYEGWEIYTYTDKPSQRALEKIKAELKRRFSGQEWLYGENRREAAIIHRITQTEIKLRFGEHIFQSEEDPADREIYHVKLEAPFFGYRGDNAHRLLRDEVYHRLPWRKRAFLLEDGARIPLARRTTFKTK
mgnify:CR=1 FL=1